MRSLLYLKQHEVRFHYLKKCFQIFTEISSFSGSSSRDMVKCTYANSCTCRSAILGTST